MEDNTSVKEYFDARIEMIPECGCWIWKLSTNEKGYGLVKIKRKLYKTHRLSWLIYRGEIPQGLCVLHTCDTPSCVNPNHLFLGTQQDNMKDCLTKKRFNPNRGEKVSSSKLTSKQVMEIRNSNDIQENLARKYNVSQANISIIKLRQGWRHI
jgi:hypothetical protein